jgi:hypothetical protein
MNRFTRAIASLAILSLMGVTPSYAEEPAPRFRSVQIYVDSGDQPLAAYQIELVVTSGDAGIVGVEGGDPPAFRSAPYYDPAALKGGRIIIAAFNTGDDLPSGKIRVATVHMEETGAAAPVYQAKLIVAATSSGKPIDARVWIVTDADRPPSGEEEKK